MTIKEIVIVYLVVINVATFLTYGIDKWKAKKSLWRIREASLLGLAVLGGSIGAWLGMKVWHHKTMHKKFKYGIPLILVVQIVIVLLTSCKTKQAVELSAPIHSHQVEQEHSCVPSVASDQRSSAPNVFLVMYDEKVGKAPLQKAVKAYKCEVIYDYNIINGMALKKPDDKTLEETMQYFKGVKGVLTVEYDHVIRLTDPIKPRLETR
jgi:uncharacterized membrane protein YsdA (DUF1294 family)